MLALHDPYADVIFLTGIARGLTWVQQVKMKFESTKNYNCTEGWLSNSIQQFSEISPALEEVPLSSIQ